MFGNGLVDVEKCLSSIRHYIDDAKNLDKNKADILKIHKFLGYYLGRHGGHIFSGKLQLLRSIYGLSASLQKTGDAALFKKGFSEMESLFAKYAECGSIYIFRHPDKNTDKSLKRLLSSFGKEQARAVAMDIRDEIMLSPKPVKVFIWTSEIARTQLMGRLIKWITMPSKTGKNVIFSDIQQHQALLFGVISPEVYALVDAYIKKFGSEKKAMDYAFLDWFNMRNPSFPEKFPGGKARFAQLVKEGKYNDPLNLEKEMISFIDSERRIVDTNDTHYKIVVGIGHSHNIDTWLYPLIGVEEVISPAEFAKVEMGRLYYKGGWKPLRQ
jgi:hypothetical protein